MDKKWKVGIFAPNSKDYLEYAQDFVMKLISDRNENIIKIRNSYFDFEIETDKSAYIFKTPSYNVRGFKWHEIFIFDSNIMNSEILYDCVLINNVIPYDFDNRENWNDENYIHFINKEDKEIPNVNTYGKTLREQYNEEFR